MKVIKILSENFKGADIFIFSEDMQKTLDDISSSGETLELKDVLEKITPKNKTAYVFKDYQDFVDVFNVANEETLIDFGLTPADIGNNNTLWMFPKYIIDMLPDGIKVNYLGGNFETDEFKKKALDELNIIMPVYPIGFIK